MKKELSVFWFRRDLRLHDNAALYHALKESGSVLPVFIFDTNILEALEDPYDRRVDFIQQAISEINAELLPLNCSLKVYHTDPLSAFKAIVKDHAVKRVYANHDYEPYARRRDAEIGKLLAGHDIEFKTYKDQCIFEKDEVLKDDGKPYTVFTPYSRKWKQKLSPFYYEAYPCKKYFSRFIKADPEKIPELSSLGFKKTDISLAKARFGKAGLQNYKDLRDYPAAGGTSRLSIHLRFGTVSIRTLAAGAVSHSETWLNELIWRDFYMMILWHFPHVAESAFKKEYDFIPWRNDEREFEKWRNGQTGFPLVDAGMRELNSTGFMHNRVRMIVSSFLVKDLLIDWRWGEAYFAKKLNDFDLSANNGGWQWAAGSGCDAAPYFRVFNPAEQQKKFDPEFKYIKKWVPEFGTPAYPAPMVDHAAARVRAISVYKKALAERRTK